MKRALALGLFVVLAVTFASSAQLHGEWDMWLKLDLDPFGLFGVLNGSGSLEPYFYSFLDIRYLVGDWTFDVAARLHEAAVNLGPFGPLMIVSISGIRFEAYGSLGGFSVWSLLYFSPDANAWSDDVWSVLQGGAAASVGGADIYGLFALEGWVGDGALLGSAFGAIGTAGDVRLGVEIGFGLAPNLWQVFQYGFEGAIVDWKTPPCVSSIWSGGWAYDYNYHMRPWYVSSRPSGCGVFLSHVIGIAEIPTCCADIYVAALFTTFDALPSNTAGFGFLSFLAKDIDIGLDWLTIYGLSVTYFLDEKDVTGWFQIATGDTVCFTPYLTVDQGTDASITGVTLNALTLSCTLGGCEFYWGHIFDPIMVDYAGYMYWPTYDWGYGFGPRLNLFGFGPLGVGLVSPSQDGDCRWAVTYEGPSQNYDCYPNEVVGVRCDEDSCCGGLFSFGVSNFLLSELPEDAPDGLTGIFGWMGTYVELTVGVGSHANLIGAIDVTALGGVEFVAFGVEVAW